MTAHESASQAMTKTRRAGQFRVFASTSPSGPALEALLRELEDCDPSAVLCFAGGEQDLAAIHHEIDERFPRAAVAGCSTAGEVGLLGCTEGGVSLMAIEGPSRAAAKMVEDLRAFRFEGGLELVSGLAQGIGRELADLVVDPERFAFLVFGDGLSGMEEVLIASLATYLPGAAIVGGSAGDDFRFESTHVAANGRVASGAAVVVLLEPNVPFHAFHVHHFEATDRSLVVTDAEPEHRIVRRVDGRPALEVLCELSGIPRESFERDPQSALMSYPPVFGFRAGGEIYMRSVMSVRGTDLLMGGATERGTILHEMRAGDLISATRTQLEREYSAVGAPAAALLFNCGGRLWEAQSAGNVDALGEVFQMIPSAGFTTYGEQCGPMQVNNTLTGLVLGHPE
jgi:hypothetical protein